MKAIVEEESSLILLCYERTMRLYNSMGRRQGRTSVMEQNLSDPMI